MVVDSTTNKLVQEWLEKAGEDLSSLRSLVRHKDGAPSTGCFLAQQTAEKLLKSLIVKYELELQKVHDLGKLAEVLKSVVPGIEQFLSEFAVLNRYYIETRYPGDYPVFGWEECQAALSAVERIEKFINRTVTTS